MEFPENGGDDLLPGGDFPRNGELDVFCVDVEEPAAQPIVHGVIDHIKKRRRSDDEGNAVGAKLGSAIAGFCQQQRTRRDPGERGPITGGAILEELFGFFQDQLRHVSERGTASVTDLATSSLVLDADTCASPLSRKLEMGEP